ncbi:sugar phosphate nucleotidyltransferase [Candidatus Palauibacter sp.]|uniref:sugar phosphate nucleotidyltransferase n=1 Tax=Candidatus Palauibacter sp. TaxID=3101350 RepID=UPI003B5B9283
MQAIIPLAGKGTRVRPHTHSRPKPLLRVANRPVLSYVIEQLRAEGVDDFIFITGHLAPRIQAYMAEEFPGLAATYVEQLRQRGTADAIALAEPYVTGPILIAFVDTLFDADFSVMQRQADASGIIWAREVEDYQRYGVILTDEAGYMKQIIEKPSEPVSKLANIGLYHVKDHDLMFEGVRHVLSRDPTMGEYFLTDAFQYMIDNGARLYTAEVDGWFDCGKPETLLETNRIMLERGHGDRPDLPVSVSVDGAVAVASDAVIEASALGPNASIASGSRIRGSRIRDTIIGRGSVIEDCNLVDSLVGDRVVLRGVRGRVSVGDDGTVEACGRARETF